MPVIRIKKEEDDVDDKNVHFIPSSSLHCTVLAQYSPRIFKYFARAPAPPLPNYMEFSPGIDISTQRIFEYFY